MQVLNTNRGLWGYTGTAADGAPLTIQSTGMGGPSTAIVAEELITLGRAAAGAGGDVRRARPAGSPSATCWWPGGRCASTARARPSAARPRRAPIRS